MKRNIVIKWCGDVVGCIKNNVAFIELEETYKGQRDQIFMIASKLAHNLEIDSRYAEIECIESGVSVSNFMAKKPNSNKSFYVLRS